VLSGVTILFFALDALGKLLQADPVVQSTVELGWPASAVIPLGLLVCVGVTLYALPRTSVIGAIYLTAFLGGAVATHTASARRSSRTCCSASMWRRSCGVGCCCATRRCLRP
jgi:hypothetical protein